MCACGKPLFWNSKTYTYAITLPIIPLTMISSFSSSNFDSKTLASKLDDLVRFVLVKSHFGFLLILDCMLLWWINLASQTFEPMRLHLEIIGSYHMGIPWMMKVEWFYVQHFLNIRWRIWVINKEWYWFTINKVTLISSVKFTLAVSLSPSWKSSCRPWYCSTLIASWLCSYHLSFCISIFTWLSTIYCCERCLLDQIIVTNLQY